MPTPPAGHSKVLTNPPRLAVEDPGSHPEAEAVGAFGSVESLDGQGPAVG